MVTKERLWPDVAIPPGETVAETLEALGMTQAELARRAGRPVQVMNEIIQGKKEITPETALEFEQVLGVPAHIWLGLEADYRFIKARLREALRLKTEVSLAEQYPYAEMAKRGWVPKVREATERVRALLRFFGVSSLRNVPSLFPAAFRKSAKVRVRPEALAAWLRQGERLAQQVKTRAFDPAALRELLQTMRTMTRRKPEEFWPRLWSLLADRGVALVLVEHLPGTGAHGATRWLGEKAVLQVSVRYRWADIFWFTLFHEIGHLLLHGKRAMFIEFERDHDGESEAEANRFATDHLIPPNLYAGFCARLRGIPTRATVEAFAEEVAVAPGIVVGRLQHDKRLPSTHLNDLRPRFVANTGGTGA